MNNINDKLEFLKGFLWGAATASFQVEGGIENNDWAEAARQGKVPVCGKACDHFNLYEKDFDIAKSLGHNSHKVSLEWSRIEPREGEFDMQAIEHYRKVIDAIIARGLIPFIGIWHFTIPDWFAKKGGFLHPDAPKIFANYAGFVTKELGDKIAFLITINEPMIYASNGYLHKKWPPFHRNFFAYLKAINSLVKAHNLAFKEIKKTHPKLPVGIAKNNIYFHSNGNPLYEIYVTFLRWFWNHRFLRRINSHQDFIGINYYFHKGWGLNEVHEKTDFGWDIYPYGLYRVLSEVKVYKKPVYVIENGLADEKDCMRAKFIVEHLKAVHKAIEKGTDVRGYLHWSLLDNYEWSEGFNKRFGLVEINYTTQERIIRPSAYVYKNICELNAIEKA